MFQEIKTDHYYYVEWVSAHLGVRELGEQGDDIVHEVLVVDDAVLALLHQDGHKLAEVGPELFPKLA